MNPSSIKIYKDTSHTFLYPQAGNYTVTQNGQITYITLVAGTLIPLNTSVYISYTYSSSGTGSGSYDTMNEIFQIRMDLWDGLLGLYGRVNAIQNSGWAGLVLNNLTSYAVGADTAWHFLRAGLEYDVYDSNLSTYNSVRLYQNLSFRPSPVSQLSFGFAESWTTYSGNNSSEQQMYSFINRYHRTLSRHWGFDLEDGVSQQNGGGTDQTLVTVRPGLEFAKGKFSLRMGYDFEYSRYLGPRPAIIKPFFCAPKEASDMTDAFRPFQRRIRVRFPAGATLLIAGICLAAQPPDWSFPVPRQNTKPPIPTPPARPGRRHRIRPMWFTFAASASRRTFRSNPPPSNG